MNNTFEFVGTLKLGRKSERFNPYETNEFKSGWANRILKLNCIAGDNRHVLEVKGGCFKDGHGKIYTYAGPTKDENGKAVQGKGIQIDWDKRFNLEEIDKVANFKKMILDLEKPGYRYKFQNLLDKSKKTELTSDELKNVGVNSLEELKTIFENSLKKREVYLSEYDFAERLHNLFSSEDLKNQKFKIQGNIKFTEFKGKFYAHYCPLRIYLANEIDEPKSDANINIFFNKNCLDVASVRETGKYFVNAYVRDYDGIRKKKIASPYKASIEIGNDQKSKTFAEIMKAQLTVSSLNKDKWYEVGVKVKIIDGAQKMPITKEILTDNEKALVEAGIITMDDIIKSHGGNVYGDRVRENLIIGFTQSYYSGSNITAFTDEDFKLPEPVQIETKASETEDLFDDLAI